MMEFLGNRREQQNKNNKTGESEKKGESGSQKHFCLFVSFSSLFPVVVVKSASASLFSHSLFYPNVTAGVLRDRRCWCSIFSLCYRYKTTNYDDETTTKAKLIVRRSCLSFGSGITLENTNERICNENNINKPERHSFSRKKPKEQ
jgi:hypothetical protein